MTGAWLAPMAAATLTLAACSYAYVLEAVEQDGKLLFRAKDDDQGTGCLTDFTIKDPAGHILWTLGSGKYTPAPCPSVLPLYYGVAPPGMKEVVKAGLLKPGVSYRISAWDGDGYSGVFSVMRPVKPADPASRPLMRQAMAATAPAS